MQNTTLDEYKAIYDAMLGMHDLVHDLIDEIEKPYFHDAVKDHELVQQRTKLALPIINAYESALAVCTERYIEILKAHRKPTVRETREVEKSLRNVFTEIMRYTETLENGLSAKVHHA